MFQCKDKDDECSIPADIHPIATTSQDEQRTPSEPAVNKVRKLHYIYYDYTTIVYSCLEYYYSNNVYKMIVLQTCSNNLFEMSSTISKSKTILLAQ